MLGLPSSRPLLSGIQTCNQVMQASFCPKERIALGVKLLIMETPLHFSLRQLGPKFI